MTLTNTTLTIYNKCWVGGSFPQEWKRVKLKIIRKSGDRDWTLTNSYRPISLLPTIGKIYERMIAARLITHLEQYAVLSDNQHGTVNAIIKLKEIVTWTHDRYAMAIFIYIQDAFDMVWWPLVTHTLRKVNISKNMQEAICKTRK